MYNILLAVLLSLLTVGGLVGFAIWVFNNLAQIGAILTWFYRLFSWISRKIMLRGVTSQIQSRINIGADLIESEVHGVMPHPIKIDWINRGEEYAQLEEGQIVVRIRNEFNNARNIVATTMLYLQEGLLKDSRPYIDHRLLQALDLDIAWELIGKNEESDVADHFLSQVFNPIVDNDPIVASYCDKIDAIDSNGVKTRIFMRELRGVGVKVIGLEEKPTRDLKAETRSFADFLHTIVTGEKGAKYPLNFIGRKIKAGILLVASLETLAMQGLRTHKWWFRKKNEMGVETTYVIATGRRNVDIARHLAQWAQDEGLVEIVQSQLFVASSKSGKAQKTIVITCHSTQAKADTLLGPEEEVQATLVRWIPEVATGEVEVLDIAREPGILSKAIIRSVSEKMDPIQACIGPNEEKLKKVRADLNESVYFIPFSEDPKVFLINCLGIPQDSINSLNIELKKKQASVIVEDRDAAAYAIGSKGINVKLTSQITGLHIKILTRDQAESLEKPQPAKSPEELLKQAVIQQIPEVANGTITIVDMVREPGIQSKVIVKQASGQETAAPTCTGKKKHHVNALVKELGESVWFVEFHQDSESYLIACLGIYPKKVLSVKINPSLRTADILVKDNVACARAIGEDGINVKQAAQLTGLRYIGVRSQEE
ncbi:Transcription termination/antitermination protein NusA [subsurface metagenome]